MKLKVVLTAQNVESERNREIIPNILQTKISRAYMRIPSTIILLLFIALEFETRKSVLITGKSR